MPYCAFALNLVCRVVCTVKMLSGIASYLFGSTAEDDFPADSDSVTLTTFPMENEWLLVDRAGMFDVFSLFLISTIKCYVVVLLYFLLDF